MQESEYESESSDDQEIMITESLELVDELVRKGKLSEWNYNKIAKSLKLAYKASKEEEESDDDSFIDDSDEEEDQYLNIFYTNKTTIIDRNAAITLSMLAIAITALAVAFY